MPIPPFSTGFLAFLLPVVWNAEPGLTYTLQQSSNMIEWEPIPMVIPGTGQDETVTLEFAGSVGFTRLRFSDDGDTNENGMPDKWELSELGHLDVNPTGDPDGDGLSNLEESRLQTDPTDFYNGQVPSLKITCGTEWLVSPGEVSVQAVTLYLQHPSGEPWPAAPVILRLPPDSGGGLCREGNPCTTSMVVFTDSLGRIHPGVDAIHYRAPVEGNASETLEVSAGDANASLLIRTIPPAMGGPPRELTWSQLPDGSWIFEWTGDAYMADAFIIESQTPSGEWIPFTRLEADEIPEADPLTKRYSIVVE